jgi:hypothetical protein
MDSSTSVDNPVNQIASLLNETPEVLGTEAEVPEKVEKLETDSLETAPEDTPDESPQEVSQTEETQNEIDTLNNLAEMLDTPVEDLYALNFNMGEGKEPVTLGGLKDFYEANGDIETVRSELKQREQDLQVEADQARDIPKVSNELMNARAQVLAIQEAYNNTNWDAIRQSNPAEWSAMQTEFNQRFNAAKANETAAQTQVETQSQQAKAYQQERLFESMPELKDDKVRAETAQAVQKMTSDFGIPKNHLESVDDAKVMRMLITLSKLYGAKDSVKTKMLDKTPASGSSAPAKAMPSTRKLALKRLTDKAKATGQTRDKTNAISALLS